MRKLLSYLVATGTVALTGGLEMQTAPSYAVLSVSSTGEGLTYMRF